MNTGMIRMNETMVAAICDLDELVRGTEDALTARIAPLVRRQSVLLDLGAVARIDAAGIAALISLYGTARDAGHCFLVANATPHVAEMLRLVGLDRFLLAEDAASYAHTGPCLQLSAA